MIEYLFVTLVALLAMGFCAWAIWSRLRPTSPRRVASDSAVARDVPDVIPGDLGARPSRGVDRVPELLRFVRTVPLPPPLPDPVEYREVRVNGSTRWVRAPYRNPDRLERLAKNGRLRADLRPG